MKQTGNLYSKYVIITDKVDIDAYNALDKDKCRQELNLPENEKLILYTGGVNELKGIRHIL